MRKFTINDVEYEVRMPNSKQRRDARRLYNRIFKEALDDGCILQVQLDDFNRQHGLWTDEDEAELRSTRTELGQLEQVLDEGGIELEEANKIADKMVDLRNELFRMNIRINQLADQTAEQQAQASQMDYFVANCTYSNNKPVFKSLDDYYERLENDDVASRATAEFSAMWYGIDEDSWTFPETKFKKEYGFLDDKKDEPKERKPFLKNGKPVK